MEGLKPGLMHELIKIGIPISRPIRGMPSTSNRIIATLKFPDSSACIIRKNPAKKVIRMMLIPAKSRAMLDIV